MGEFNLYGVYVPTFLLQAILAYALFKLVVLALEKWLERGWILYPGIFYFSLYLILLLILHWIFIFFSS